MLTMIIMPCQVFSVDEEVVIFVEFPELAIDDVEVLVAEEVSDLIDVLLLEFLKLLYFRHYKR